MVGLEFDVGGRGARDLVHPSLDRSEARGLDFCEEHPGLDAALCVDAEVEDGCARREFVRVDAEFLGEVDGLVDEFDGHPVDRVHRVGLVVVY